MPDYPTLSPVSMAAPADLPILDNPSSGRYDFTMNWQEYIERDPQIMLGKPVFKGTRLTVEYILERLGQGASPEELVENYEGLTLDHIRAAQAYAASVLRHDELVYQAS
jgi:uncharacterized protein (DUF433 family)